MGRRLTAGEMEETEGERGETGGPGGRQRKDATGGAVVRSP